MLIYVTYHYANLSKQRLLQTCFLEPIDFPNVFLSREPPWISG